VLCLRGRAAFAGGTALVVAAEALLAWSLVPADDLRRLVDAPLRVGAVVVAAGAVVAAGLALARFPVALPLLALAAAPFRIPTHLGGQDAFLLVPLYGVIAAGVVALAVRAARGLELGELPRLVAWPAAGFVGWSAVSLLWSTDLRAGTIDLLFFLFPFVALVIVLARAPYRQRLPGGLATVQVALALAFAGIGIWQLWSERLFFAKDLEVANAYTDYFRTTSVFADSSLYGLQLALGIVIVLVGLWAGGLSAWLGVPAVAALWTGLYFTYSQSSMVALVVAALAVTVVAADRRSRVVLAAGAVVVALAGAGLVAVSVKGDSAQRFTSGRSELVSGTARVFADHPLVGVGVGAQPKESRKEGGKRETRRNASHTTPLTVAAEGGVIGLLLYVAFLLGAVKLLGLVHAARPVLGLGLAGCFLVLFVHSLLYAGFFHDPLTWGILGVASSALAALARASESPPVSVPAAGAVAATPVRGRWQT
jgi:hypothetical protein